MKEPTDEQVEDKMKCMKCGKIFDPDEIPPHQHESWEILPEYKEEQDG